MKVSSNKALSNAEIQKIIKSVKPRRSAGFCVWSLPNDMATYRIACALAKHKLGLATKRNRLKRVIKAFIQTKQKKFVGHDWVLGLERKWTDLPDKKILWQNLRQCFGVADE